MLDLAAADADPRVGFEGVADGGRKAVAVDRQRATGGDRGAPGGGDHQRAEALHLALQ